MVTPRENGVAESISNRVAAWAMWRVAVRRIARAGRPGEEVRLVNHQQVEVTEALPLIDLTVS